MRSSTSSYGFVIVAVRPLELESQASSKSLENTHTQMFSGAHTQMQTQGILNERESMKAAAEFVTS